MLTCDGCRVARFCSTEHQKVVSKGLASGWGDCCGVGTKICVVFSESGGGKLSKMASRRSLVTRTCWRSSSNEGRACFGNFFRASRIKSAKTNFGRTQAEFFRSYGEFNQLADLALKAHYPRVFDPAVCYAVTSNVHSCALVTRQLLSHLLSFLLPLLPVCESTLCLPAFTSVLACLSH